MVCHDKGEKLFSVRMDRQTERDGFQVTWQAPASEQTNVTVLILETHQY